MATVEGNESFNVIQHNFVADVIGTGKRAGTGGDGTQGDGYWLAGMNNFVRDNVATDIGAQDNSSMNYGFTLYGNCGNKVIPAFQGADDSQSGQSKTINVMSTLILEFSGNEVYGATGYGLGYFYVGANNSSALISAASVIKDLHLWHIHYMGVFGYYSSNLTFDGLVIRDDLPASQVGYIAGVFQADYFTKDFVITNSDIQGVTDGFIPSTHAGGLITIENSYMRNYNNDIRMDSLWFNGADSTDIPPRKVIVDNVKFDAPPGQALISIVMNGAQAPFTNTTNLIQLDQLFVINYNQVAGDNFQVFYTQRAANFVLPQTIINKFGYVGVDASPVSNLTKQQTWAQYGIAYAGAVAPSTATTMDGIDGLVA